MLFNNLEQSIGVSVSATTLEKQTDAVIATANSVNSLPVFPVHRQIGMNTATSTRVVAITAKTTWSEPRTDARSGCSPSSILRWMFSNTTMVSSTTIPIASTRASRVSRFTL